jgi:DNA-binding SARP family transcriptional activator
VSVEFRILGPLEVRSESGVVALGGIKPRAVLAVLLLHANESVHVERLALALWGEDVPASAVKTVQAYVSRLRKALGDAEILATTPAGYCLRVRADELDAERFVRLVEDGRRALDAGRAEHAAGVLCEALALWRGPPLGELAFEPFAQIESNGSRPWRRAWRPTWPQAATPQWLGSCGSWSLPIPTVSGSLAS